MTITLIDSFAFFFRAYYALPNLKSRSGIPTGLLTGLVNFINNLHKDKTSDAIIFCLEGEGEKLRQIRYPLYKANRSEAPLELREQITIAIEWLEKMGFTLLRVNGYEADDIIASLSTQAKNQGWHVRIVSSDKDLYQLIDTNVFLWDPMKKQTITRQECFDKFGVYPEEIITYQSLVGDSSDNVPGVKGIGAKTASELVRLYPSLDEIYANLEILKPKTAQLLRENQENALLSQELVTLHTDLPLMIDMQQATFPTENPLLAIQDELEALDIKALLTKNRIPLQQKPLFEQSLAFRYKTLYKIEDIMNIISSYPKETIVAFDIETTGLDVRYCDIVGFSFSFDAEIGYYVPLGHNYLGVEEQLSYDNGYAVMQKLFNYRIVGHNIKFDLSVVQRFVNQRLVPYGDTMIMAWLIHSDQMLSLDALAKKYLSHTMISYKETAGKENFSHVLIEDASRYAAEDAVMTWRLYHRLLPLLDKEISQEYYQIELPFLTTLMTMENRGIMLDLPFFETLEREATQTLAQLVHHIYHLAGCEFNINSTKQLADILFNRLGLIPPKKTKTGYSTDESVLVSLYNEHPIISPLLEYRELFKLFSTYIKPLIELGSKHSYHRVFSSFNQTGTATGRLSSTNPNLQNIPVKTEVGRKIRYGFCASEGKKLVGIDYSQIELRLLAHFTQDETLINAFNNHLDIHYETACKLFGQEKALEQRSIAKTVNFGILYGMGSRKLSQTLGISLQEAKRIIDDYFCAFSSVQSYFEEIKRQVHEQGYVQTLLGRRRYFDFNGATAMQIASFEREAVNAIFQGSAADLIKSAMNMIHKDIIEENLPAQLILQIHDELIFEIDDAYVSILSERFSTIMTTNLSLRVPLDVGIGIGQTWGDLKG